MIVERLWPDTPLRNYHYLVACAETTDIGRIASFDRTIDRVSAVERIEP